MTTKQKITLQITEAVSAYRRAFNNKKQSIAGGDTPQTDTWKRACDMMMDRAAGALDALWEIDPKNPAWRDTDWVS